MKQRVSREEICLYQPVANNYKGLHIYPFSRFATEIVTVVAVAEKVSSIMNIVAMNFLFIKCLLIQLLILGLGIPYSGKIVSLSVTPRKNNFCRHFNVYFKKYLKDSRKI